VTTTQSTSTIATDPLRDFNFTVVIQPNDPQSPGGALKMGWQTVSGIGFDMAPIQYRQGGSNIVIQNMPDQVTWSPVTLARGMTMGATQLQIGWFLEIFGLLQGVGNANSTVAGGGGTTGGQNANADFRASIFIYVNEHPNTTGTPVTKAGLKFYNAFPYQMQYGDLDAGSNGLFVYSMTFCHEGMDATVAGATDSIKSMAGNAGASNSNWIQSG